MTAPARLCLSVSSTSVPLLRQLCPHSSSALGTLPAPPLPPSTARESGSSSTSSRRYRLLLLLETMPQRPCAQRRRPPHPQPRHQRPSFSHATCPLLLRACLNTASPPLSLAPRQQQQGTATTADQGPPPSLSRPLSLCNFCFGVVGCLLCYAGCRNNQFKHPVHGWAIGNCYMATNLCMPCTFL
jgi:hypothetical protein